VTSPEAELRRTWHRVAGRGHDDVLDEVLARHREPHRRYHTALHVMWVCRHVDRLIAADGIAIAATDADTIRAAALFHDAVYDPRATDNEPASARLADLRLADVGWADDRRADVRRLIELTAGHEVDADDVPGAVLLDADLAILGAEANEYRHYATGVRVEYAQVDDAGWREGRAKVLRHFLDRDAIFLTETMHAERESRARANLTAELATLRD
jgi:predicted metal-dependent HD superfamily phosphohydrolase